jgi:putative heme iron utilization protein
MAYTSVSISHGQPSSRPVARPDRTDPETNAGMAGTGGKKMTLHTRMGKPGTEAFLPIPAARRVLRVAATGSLATLDTDGFPFASLVTVAMTVAGEPLFLLSDLAVHTRNLKRDSRASVLLVAPGGEAGDPLAGARLTVTGNLARDDAPETRRRFLAHHADSANLAEFSDFNFYRLNVTWCHLVAGFGRIVDLTREELLIDVADCGPLLEAEAGAVEHMNDDHAGALSLYATKLLGMPAGGWTATGADPEGLDLRAGSLRARLDFPHKVRNGGDLRAVLVHFAKEARAGA